MMDEKLSKVVRAFGNIGRSNGTAPPETGSNTFGAAYEFAVASRLRELANARYDQAKVDAIASGVLPNLDGISVGTHVVYTSDHLDVVVRRNNDSATIDKTLLTSTLTKEVGAVKALQLIAASSKPKKGQTVISVANK